MAKKILVIAGARPNFIKIAPLHRAFQQYPDIHTKLIHTGQHYDASMSAVFFDQLALPAPDHCLGIGSGTSTWQTASTMLAFEKIAAAENPDLVLVTGDVNATLACALASAKMGIPVAHVEAGLRSGDRTMPEEINRILTDSVSDYLFVTEPSGVKNLKQEGVAPEKIFYTGNCMIDSLVQYRNKILDINILTRLGLSPKQYVLMTMHRPSNVDTAAGLQTILHLIGLITPIQPVVFPIHPRTKKRFEEAGSDKRLPGIKNLYLLSAQGYLEFQHLLANATAVVTDSGGVQEESTFWQVPCITFRETTERPVTVETGTNELAQHPDLVQAKILQVLKGAWKQGKVPDLWDGKAAERIAALIERII